MIRDIETESKAATQCTDCGRLLMNPGYGKQNVYCCGRYRQWYNCITTTTIVDDGRNEKGQFSTKPKLLERKQNIWMHGGKI